MTIMPRLALTILILVPLGVAQERFRVTDAERAEGWMVLFDGVSPAGWRGYRKDAFPTKGWVIEDGCLRVQAGGGGGDIVTKEQWSDFELSLEWKVAPGANSGIIYRVAETRGTSWQTGPEFQILDDAAHGERLDAKHAAGSLYALVTAQGKTLRPTGEFNVARVVVKGDHVEHWLNGTKVLEATIAGDAWDALVQKTKFASMPEFARHRRGHIALQDHGNDVWFRRIKIRSLEDRTAKPWIALFDGKGMDAWTHHLRGGGALADVWTIDQGVLVCKGRPAGYIRTRDDFENFLLTVEWRWSPTTKKPGNSGVLFRMIGEDKVWPKSIEAQLMHGNAGDFWCIDRFPMSTAADRLRGRNTRKTHGNENPVGEWNRYDITADRGHVVLRVNGEILNEARACEEVPGKICLQSEGAEIHFRNVRLVKLRGSR